MSSFHDSIRSPAPSPPRGRAVTNASEANQESSAAKASAKKRASRARKESLDIGGFAARVHPLSIAMTVLLLAAFVWSYFPTLLEIVRQWNVQPDYSHGYFVVPVAVFLLWMRRDSFPGLPGRFAWSGLVLLLASLGLRWLGGYYFLGSVDAWSMVVWCAGVVCLFGGWRVLWWASPAILFLLFMIPLPYSGERMLSLPLQGIATTLSTAGLRLFGQPALAEGHTILLGETRLEVVQACSGLRIFVGILALAFAYVFIVRRPIWQKFIVGLSVIPVTLIANSTRIVITGLLSQHFSSDAAHTFTHDLAGWFMIPFAAGLFALVLWYLNRAFVAEEEVAPESLLRLPRKRRQDSRAEKAAVSESRRDAARNPKNRVHPIR